MRGVDLPSRLKKIWVRASSPRGSGLPVPEGEFTVERLNAGYFSSRKQHNKLRMHKEFLRRKQAVISTLEEIRIELSQFEEISLRDNGNFATGEGENLSSADRRQWVRLMKRIDERRSQHPSFYSYHLQRLRFVAVGWSFVYQFTGEPF